MIYLDKFLHFISADGHHYKVPSSDGREMGHSQPFLKVGGRPFATHDPAQDLKASKPLPLACLSSDAGYPRVYILSNVARSWTGRISISDNQGSVSVESERASYFGMSDTGMYIIDNLYFGYKVYIEFYDEHFRLKTTSDWIEWAYRDRDELTHRLRRVYVTLSDSARYVKIRYNCFQSSDATDSGPHVDYASDYIRIYSTPLSIDSTSKVYFIFSEQIS